jgi:hypothetical protein
MNEQQLNDLDQMDLTFEDSDEMLETAAGMEMGKPKAYTLSFCSGLSTCPA